MKIKHIEISVGDQITLQDEPGIGVVDRTYADIDRDIESARVRWDNEDGSQYWRLITPTSKGVTVARVAQ